MRYQIFTYSSKNKPIMTLPWFWLAHFICAMFKNHWIEGWVVDSKTGDVPITWELSGLILGDGLAHLTVHGVKKGPPPISQEKQEVLLHALIAKDGVPGKRS